MINYALACDNGHEFDGWFRNSADYDKQHGLGLVTCPMCDSAKVQKRLMAPNVSTSRTQKKAQVEQQVKRAVEQAQKTSETTSETKTGTTAPAVAAAAETPAKQTPSVDLQAGAGRAKELVEALREFRKQVVANTEYVGDKFADEARKIHYGESEERGIYGETTPKDAKELMEEGIDLMPLPVLPEDRN